MRNCSIIAVTVIAIVVAGCDRNAPTAPASAINRQMTRFNEAPTVPFKTNSYTFHQTSVVSEPGCANRVSLSGEGTATHLGQYAVTLSFCREPGVLRDGRGAFVAADGDLLAFTFEGTSTVTPSTVSFVSFARFIGGTGRFIDASGNAVVTGTIDRITGISTGAWDGTLSGIGGM